MIEDIRVGDIFLTTDPDHLLSKMIIKVQKKLLSQDKKAECSHAAHFCIDGNLLDTLWIVKSNPLNSYKGKPCMIYRPLVYRKDLINACTVLRKKVLGKRYPWIRLILHLSGLADNIHWNRRVCSENVCYMLHLAFRNIGVFDFEHYYGKSPDWIADICKASPHFDLVYKGVV